MNSSIINGVRILVHAAWRRRYLILIPLLIGIPLSLAAALMAPKQYRAEALLLLQETNSQNPLLSGDDPQPVARDKLAALTALLKSDWMLSSVIDEIGAPEDLSSEEARARAKKELDQRLGLNLIGQQFLSFSLTGSKAEGLGDDLNAIVTRFVEALLLPNQLLVGAPQLVIAKREAELAEIRKQTANAQQIVQGGNLERLEQARDVAIAARGQQAETVVSAQETVEKRRQAIGQLGLDPLRASEILAGLNAPAGDEAGASADEKVVAALQELVSAEAALAKAQAELAQAEASVASQQEAIESYSRAQANMKALGDSLRVAERRLIAERQRLRDIQTDGTLKILRAPEFIRVVDKARDPKIPERGRFIYFLLGVMASVALAGGAAALAELLDDRIRDREGITNALGVPVIIDINQPGGAADGADAGGHDRGSPPGGPGSVTKLRQVEAA